MVIGVVNLSRWLKGTSSSKKIVMSGFKTCGSSNLGTSVSGGESDAQEEQSVSVSPVLKECLASSVQSTPEIEKKYVHRVYDAIAPHFSSTRFAKWPKVATFLNSLPPGSLILDAGCGNGKYLGFTPDSFFIGCDISAPLVGICADRGHEVVVADAVNLPYQTGYGDAAISIAVLHHLSTEIRRKKAIDELVRVVKRGGLVLITVWAVEQEDKTLLNKWTPLIDKYVDEWVGPGSPRTHNSSPFTLGSSSSFTLESIPEAEENGSKEKLNKFRDSSSVTKGSEYGQVGSEGKDHLMEFEAGEKRESHQEYFVPWHLPYHRADVSGASVGAVANGLAKKDDKKGAIVYNRYYHVFSEGELERLVSGMKNAVVVDRFYDKSNWCIILRRT